MISSVSVKGTTLYVSSHEPLAISFGSLLKKMSENEFFRFCEQNPNFRIERTKEGDVIVMPPVYSETGNKIFNLAGQFYVWSKQNKTGIGFDSSAGFTLPDGATRSPDISWIRLERWNNLAPEKRAKFAHIAPDFVIELRSATDRLKDLQAKMEEYVENGMELGWLIDTQTKRVYIYQPNEKVEVLENPKEVSGEPLLKGFVLNLKKI